MTITNTITRDSFVGDGVATSFPTTFPFFESSDLVVLEIDTVADTKTLLTEGVEYTVLGGNGATGSVEAATAPTSDKTWVIERVSSRTQSSDYGDDESTNRQTLENDLDRNAMRDLEVDRDLARALHFPREDDPTTISSELPKVSDRASKLAGFGASGEATAVDPVTLSPGTVTVGAFGQTLLPLASKGDWQTTLEIFALQGILTTLGGDTLANRPTAAAFGNGIYFATDTGQLFHSNGSVWTEMGQLDRFALASLPSAGDAGRTYVDTTRFHAHVDTGSAVQRIRSPLSRGTLGGLQTTRAAGDITIAPGWARVGVAADPDQDDAQLTASLQKLITATWVAGTGNGGRASAVTLTADTWYHLFLLLDPANGNVDAGFDTDIGAANLLSDTLSAGYTKFRRLWSVKTEVGSTDLRSYTQRGDRCIWVDSAISFDPGSVQDYTGADTKIALNDAPPDVSVEVLLAAFASGLTSGEVRIDHGDASIGASPVLDGTGPLPNFTGSGTQDLNTLVLSTDTSQQLTIRVVTDTTVRPILEVLSYRDSRGRFD